MTRTDLTFERDVVILAETFLPELPAFKPGVPKILFNQNGAYNFGIVGKRFVKTQVLELYRDLQQIWCVSEHDRRLLVWGWASLRACEAARERPGASGTAT